MQGEPGRLTQSDFLGLLGIDRGTFTAADAPGSRRLQSRNPSRELIATEIAEVLVMRQVLRGDEHAKVKLVRNGAECHLFTARRLLLCAPQVAEWWRRVDEGFASDDGNMPKLIVQDPNHIA